MNEVESFLAQYVYCPLVKTVYVDAKIWDQMPKSILLELKEDISVRGHWFDQIGKVNSDDRALGLARAFNDLSMRVVFLGPYGEVEFKRRSAR